MKTTLFVRLLPCIATIPIVVGCVSVGHPNLDAARQYVRDAISKVTAARQANNYDMQGHAAKAKRLMEQVIQEINPAEQAASL